MTNVIFEEVGITFETVFEDLQNRLVKMSEEDKTPIKLSNMEPVVIVDDHYIANIMVLFKLDTKHYPVTLTLSNGGFLSLKCLIGKISAWHVNGMMKLLSTLESSPYINYITATLDEHMVVAINSTLKSVNGYSRITTNTLTYIKPQHMREY